MTGSDDNRLSTSALAKRLKLPIQQLFVTLRDYGWIDRRGKSWALTGKGELQGGSYQESQRFGRYIVWPDSLLEHPLLSAIETNQRITPGGMRRYYPHLGVRQINRNFAELGMLSITRRGLELTSLGEHFGGRQEHDEDNGLLLISWPHEIVDNPVIHRELNRLVSDGFSSESPIATAASTDPKPDLDSGAIAPDLFATPANEPLQVPRETVHARCGLDGHAVDSLLQLRVCDWLYEAQLAHARDRSLPVEEPLTADFYVPAVGLYIECWERDVPTSALSRRLRTREVCRELKLAYQEIAATDIERVDDLLTKRVAELSRKH
ncbi:hypothetical protein R0135_03230 [Congregibacter variabilis]|uniref:Uncharacterized protein n=1 Tax=Congregibacter variabilis TaxID=3081200 RepID=A0ABZ0I563_9GAMM|nr:hypothetical protein R0135_03230 [Congregibacter sp. IMCC43200]